MAHLCFRTLGRWFVGSVGCSCVRILFLGAGLGFKGGGLNLDLQCLKVVGIGRFLKMAVE